jgi:cytochrome P450
MVAKGMMFTSIAHLLFGLDAKELADPFVQAASFAEEYWVNGDAIDGSPGTLGRQQDNSFAVQNHTAETIARGTRMIGAHEQISPDRVTAIVRTLLNSYNATATAVIWVLLQLAQHGSVLERVHHEIDRVIGTRLPDPGHMRQLPFTRSVVMEVLRLFPPAWAFGRVAIAENRIGDTLVPARATISVSPYTLQRDARFWRKPNDFLPERFTSDRPDPNSGYAYLPFGGGQRRCPAAALNVGFVQMIVTSILRLARIEVTNHQPIKPRGLVALRTDPPVLARFLART